MFKADDFNENSFRDYVEIELFAFSHKLFVESFKKILRSLESSSLCIEIQSQMLI